MLPPAPARLSTTQVQPVAAPILSASMRDTTSVPPAGGNGTTSLIGWFG